MTDPVRRTLVVTGAASGVGAALVQALSTDWNILALDRHSVVAPVAGVVYTTVDVSTVEGVQMVADVVDDRFEGRIDALVHCAAIGQFDRFADTSRASWESVLQVNLHGTLGLVGVLQDRINDDGRVVLFASASVFRAPGGAAAYIASKAGVIGFVRGLAGELGERRITVNAIAPGLIITAMTEHLASREEANQASRAIQRPASPEDLIEPVRFFLSSGAGYVTGQTLVVDGGAVKH